MSEVDGVLGFLVMVRLAQYLVVRKLSFIQCLKGCSTYRRQIGRTYARVQIWRRGTRLDYP